MTRGGRRGKRGQKGGHAENSGQTVKKKIEKRSAEKRSAKKVPSDLVASASVAPVLMDATRDVAQGKLEKVGNSEKLPGFIFMCNGQTKSDCYQYRVFGLSSGKLDVVERIKEGTKLFLFDFDLKLLYGIYKATSSGQRDLEPSAFGGRFSAQVRFKISKDCLPLPEKQFKHAIQENYEGYSKFKQELSNRQVRKLIELFRPITLPPSGQAPRPPPKVDLQHRNPPPDSGDRFQWPVRLPPHESGYATESHIVRVPPPLEARYGHPASLPSQSGTYYAEPPQPYMPENPASHAQDPYSRYRTVPEVVHRERESEIYHRSVLERERESKYHRLLLERERESEYHRSLLERERDLAQRLDRGSDYYNQLATQATSHPPAPQSYALAPPSYAPAPPSYAPAPPSYAIASSYAPAPSYAPPSYAPQTHAPVEYRSGYYSTVGYDDPNRVLGDPLLQRSATGRVGVAGESVPVSSLYSFAGSAPTYH
ncbi:hypothetical protein IFM89_009064 [Coptis chinensis]|uniref:DCD domain-containing protein n=1 Tax=Coptis chinensis TaxID=261450 RepID=A0A835INC8_9MAGN|nr:hypothetical protein IFM89_009064 [Coptis chinensis]